MRSLYESTAAVSRRQRHDVSYEIRTTIFSAYRTMGCCFSAPIFDLDKEVEASFRARVEGTPDMGPVLAAIRELSTREEDSVDPGTSSGPTACRGESGCAPAFSHEDDNDNYLATGETRRWRLGSVPG